MVLGRVIQYHVEKLGLRLMCHGLGRHKMFKKTFTYVPREGTKCATARHKKTFRLLID
jgi:hypothetical protein